MNRAARGWTAAGGIAYAILPWYGIEDGTFGLSWLSKYPIDRAVGPALVQALVYGRLSLLPLVVCLLAPLAIRSPSGTGAPSSVLLAAGAGGMAWIALQGFAVGDQAGIGIGGLVVAAALLMIFCVGLAAKGASTATASSAGDRRRHRPRRRLRLLSGRARPRRRHPGRHRRLRAGRVLGQVFRPGGVGLDCLGSSASCGVAWNSVLLGVLVGASTTALGLAFALIVTRTEFRAKRALRMLTVLPIITPPFVIGLAVILLFGRAGAVTTFMEWAFGVVPSRWIYGLPGVWLAQVLAFTPIAFLVLIGVVEGVSPSMEEAAQTLRADRWRTFTTVSLALMRPGLANAFLLGFIEASPTSAIRSSSAAISPCCRSRSSLRWSGPSTTAAVPRCSRSCCSRSRSAPSTPSGAGSVGARTPPSPARETRAFTRRSRRRSAGSSTQRRCPGPRSPR